MRFELMSDWPGPRSVMVAAGTIIDGTSPAWTGVPMPLCARALDVEGANALVSWHAHQQHLLHFANGVQPTLKLNV